ncbi:MAG TPA: heavy-metal-associated domain-containing protein [Burkholderiales bacterium]|nr:heavy-metal-associated domain-containing protein [Burkholderiales bacterium]
METITLGIKGMTCGGCVASVQRVLKALDGVDTVDVSLEREQATIEYESGRVDPVRLRAVIEDAGYEVVR